MCVHMIHVHGSSYNVYTCIHITPHMQSGIKGLQEGTQFGVAVVAHPRPVHFLVLAHEPILRYLVIRLSAEEVMHATLAVCH